MKNDAAVLFGIIQILSAYTPQDTQPAFAVLHRYNSSQPTKTDIIFAIQSSCQTLRHTVTMFPNSNEAQQRYFLGAIQAIESSVSLGNMGQQWNGFINNLNLEANKQSLTFLDYLISNSALSKLSSTENDDELQSHLNELAALVEKSSLNEYARSLIKLEIDKILTIFQTADKFGAQDFWDRYQKLTGLMCSQFELLNDIEKDEMKPVLSQMFRSVGNAMAPYSNYVTVGTFLFEAGTRLLGR